MTSSLNLTDSQKQKAQSIFDSAYQQAQTLRDQMYEKRKAYWNSQKPMSDAEIDKLAAERAELSAKMQATRDKAFANFYNNVLTAEQRTKYDQLRASAGPGPGMGGRGSGFCPRGRGW
jgi:Spy/CpxP family protein refolding chaperone